MLICSIQILPNRNILFWVSIWLTFINHFVHLCELIRQEKGKAAYKCQRQTLYVSFRDIKWDDWIIAPDGFSANYCHGICSFPTDDSMNATNHAIIQQLHRMMHHKVPRPVCATISLSPISILHLNNESNTILRKFDNMVAKSCGCVWNGFYSISLKQYNNINDNKNYMYQWCHLSPLYPLIDWVYHVILLLSV